MVDEHHDNLLDIINEKDKQIAELKEENAELKEENAELEAENAGLESYVEFLKTSNYAQLQSRVSRLEVELADITARNDECKIKVGELKTLVVEANNWARKAKGGTG